MTQVELHPSPFTVFPSSQPSLEVFTPLPQVSIQVFPEILYPELHIVHVTFDPLSVQVRQLVIPLQST
jgi:hypothetical protein